MGMHQFWQCNFLILFGDVIKGLKITCLVFFQFSIGQLTEVTKHNIKLNIVMIICVYIYHCANMFNKSFCCRLIKKIFHCRVNIYYIRLKAL